MIRGLGIDVVELDRIEAALARFSERFLARILTPAERAALPASRLARTAGLFAAKEAAVKALGTGWGGGVGWRDVEVTRDAAGAPALALHRAAAARAAALGSARAHVSISHDGGLAIAVVVLDASARAA